MSNILVSTIMEDSRYPREVEIWFNDKKHTFSCHCYGPGVETPDLSLREVVSDELWDQQAASDFAEDWIYNGTK